MSRFDDLIANAVLGGAARRRGLEDTLVTHAIIVTRRDSFDNM
jgi:hypothetical protein